MKCVADSIHQLILPREKPSSFVTQIPMNRPHSANPTKLSSRGRLSRGASPGGGAPPGGGLLLATRCRAMNLSCGSKCLVLTVPACVPPPDGRFANILVPTADHRARAELKVVGLLLNHAGL